MNQASTVADELATDISDRAFRLYCLLVLRAAGEWERIPDIASALNLKPYQVRAALAELGVAGMVQKERRYESGTSGRKTWRTYVRMVDDVTSAAAVGQATEDVA